MDFEITILGSGSATPMRGRNMSAQVVKLNSEYLLIDCGEGTQYQLLRYHIPHSKINHILISHLHGDHFFGLVALVSTMNMLGRKTPLHIYGPAGLDEILTVQFRYSDTILNYAMVFHVLKEDFSECIIDEEHWEVHTIPLSHRIRCNGFLIKEKPKRHRIHKPSLPENITLAEIAQIKQGKDIFNTVGEIIYHAEDYLLPPHRSRSYAYCSDTCFHPDMFDLIRKVDVLYHESTFLEALKPRAIETFHTTAREAAITGATVDCHTLIIGHFSSRYKELLPFLEEARPVFPNTFLGIEGTKINIDERNEVTEYVHVQA